MGGKEKWIVTENSDKELTTGMKAGLELKSYNDDNSLPEYDRERENDDYSAQMIEEDVVSGKLVVSIKREQLEDLNRDYLAIISIDAACENPAVVVERMRNEMRMRKYALAGACHQQYAYQGHFPTASYNMQ